MEVMFQLAALFARKICVEVLFGLGYFGSNDVSILLDCKSFG